MQHQYEDEESRHINKTRYNGAGTSQLFSGPTNSLGISHHEVTKVSPRRRREPSAQGSVSHTRTGMESAS